MARSLVQLSGDRTDLEEFPRWFPDGEIFAIKENGTFFLTGPAFEALPSAEAVLNEAIRALDLFSAVISLVWPSLRKPAGSHVFRETDEGKRNAFVFLSGSITVRAKLGAALSVGSPPEGPQPTQAQQLLTRAKQSPHLEVALSLWADPVRSWPRLYRVLEEIEQHLGRRVNAVGLCSANERDRFARTANTAEVSGPDARHAVGKFVPPANPMDLGEGTSFVSRLLLEALQKVQGAKEDAV